MAVNLARPEAASLHPVAGVRVGVAAAGIKKPGRKDLLLIALDPGATVAGVFTRNRFCAAPVLVAREHLASGSAIRALVVNTGNANAGTGDDGLARARKVCAAAAAQRQVSLPWQCLYFLPEPHGHGSLRPTFCPSRTKGCARSAPSPVSSASACSAASSPPANSAC